jgi:hypothetical protein
MPDEKTLQVILSLQEAAGVKALADQLGISVSAYLRRLILARSVPLIAAWWVHEFDAFDDKPAAKYRAMQSHGLGIMARSSAIVMLELITDQRDEYLVFDAYGRTVTEEMFRTGMHDIFRSQRRSCLMLAGSQDLWFIERSIANSRAGGQLRWRLERWEQPKD